MRAYSDLTPYELLHQKLIVLRDRNKGFPLGITWEDLVSTYNLEIGNHLANVKNPSELALYRVMCQLASSGSAGDQYRKCLHINETKSESIKNEIGWSDDIVANGIVHVRSNTPKQFTTPKNLKSHLRYTFSEANDSDTLDDNDEGGSSSDTSSQREGRLGSKL